MYHEVNLHDLIGKIFTVVPRGSAWTTEEHDSLIIYENRFQWHSAGWSGDALDWQGHQLFGNSWDSRNSSMFREVLEELGLSDDAETVQQNRYIRSMHQVAVEYFHSNLTGHWYEWLEKEYGISEATIDELKIGYAPLGNGLIAALSDEGYSEEDILSSGLVVKSNDKIHDFYQGRIVFPFWKNKKPVYFSARKTSETPNRPWEEGKYKKALTHSDKHPYVSESISNHYYYEDAKGDQLIITEGITDAIYANQEGIPTVALCSLRAFDLDKLTSLCRGKDIYICLDSEQSNAGQEAAQKLALELWEKGVRAKIITLPRPASSEKIDLNGYLRAYGISSFWQLSCPTLFNGALRKVETDKSNENLKAAFDLIAYIDDEYELSNIRNRFKQAPLKVDKASFDAMLQSAHAEKAKKNPHPLMEKVKELSDGGLADYWIELNEKNWFYVAPQFKFHQWAVTHWEPDNNLHHRCLIQKMMKQLHGEAESGLAASTTDKQAQSLFKQYIKVASRDNRKVSSVASLVADHLSVDINDVNASNVLNLKNGTLDLDTLRIKEHSYDDRITYCLDYEYDLSAKCPLYEYFLKTTLVHPETFETDRELIDLWDEFVGYCLTNDISHHSMLWLSGGGGNGKSVAVDVLKSLVGELAIAIDFHTVGEQGDYSLARLPGKRVALSTESQKGKRINEGIVKAVVSGDYLTARAIREAPFDFKSQAKIVWAMNHNPVITDTTESIWRRMILIPFNRTFEDGEKDIKLPQKLKAELPGILNRSIAGLMRLRENGHFTKAKQVESAIAQYRYDSSPIQQWIDECTEHTSQEVQYTVSNDLYQDYRRWCGDNGRQLMASNTFGKELKNMHIEKKRTSSGTSYALCLRS